MHTDVHKYKCVHFLWKKRSNPIPYLLMALRISLILYCDSTELPLTNFFATDTIYLEIFRNRSIHGVLRNHESHIRSPAARNALTTEKRQTECGRNCSQFPQSLRCHCFIPSLIAEKSFSHNRKQIQEFYLLRTQCLSL